MIVAESLLRPESLDRVQVCRDSLADDAVPDLPACLPYLQDQLQASPTIECLKSLGFNIEWKNEDFLVNFPSDSQTIEIGGDLRELVNRSDNAPSDTSELVLEMIGCWALARHVLASRKTLTTNPPEVIYAAATKWFLLRPLLHYLWQGHSSLDASFVHLLLKTFLDSKLTRSLSEILNAQNSYEDLLAAALAAVGSSESVRREIREIEHERFSPPEGKRVAYFRSRKDGFIVPVFCQSGFKFISKYRPNAGSPTNFSDEDLRYPYHVPLKLETDKRLSKTFGPVVDYLTTPLFRLLREPHVYFVTVGKDDVDESTAEYSVLVHGAPLVRSDRTLGTSGRTGVLFRHGLPVVVELDGIQYLVEIKGMGCPDGGFPLLAQRANARWSVLGGLLQSYAQDEFSSLCEMEKRGSEETSIKPVCLMSIDRQVFIDDPGVITDDSVCLKLSEHPQKVQILEELGEKQSILIRLTPAVERLSFLHWSEAFERGDTEETKRIRSLGGLPLEERVTCYGAMLARLFKAPRRQGHLAAHMENIVAGSYVPLWQDFADVVDLYVSRSHYDNPLFVDRRSLTLNVLNRTFYHVAMTSKLLHDSFGLTYSTFSALFYRSFALELFGESRLGVDPARQMVAAREPLRLRDKRGITAYLWDEHFALDNYLWCTQNYDLPAAIFGSGAHPSPESMLRFINSEIAFLNQAKHVAESAPHARSPELIAELEGNISAANTLLNEAQEKQLTKLPLLPYLQKSQVSPCPRKPKSWSP